MQIPTLHEKILQLASSLPYLPIGQCQTNKGYSKNANIFCTRNNTTLECPFDGPVKVVLKAGF